MDFYGLEPAEPLNWSNFADDFIFEPRTPHIIDSIKSINNAKIGTENDFK